MVTTDVFICRLSGVVEDLRSIYSDYAELYEDYLGKEFLEQELLAGVVLDNLIAASSDEIASHLQFKIQSIIDLTNFIEFRKRHKMFTDEELHKIIDNDNFLGDFKSNLASLNLEKKKQYLDQMKYTRSEWNKLFNNRTYSNFKKIFIS